MPGSKTGLLGLKTSGEKLKRGRRKKKRKKEEKRERKEEKKRRKRKERRKEGDGLYLKGAPDVRHAPTREARKIFEPFFG